MGVNQMKKERQWHIQGSCASNRQGLYEGLSAHDKDQEQTRRKNKGRQGKGTKVKGTKVKGTKVKGTKLQGKKEKNKEKRSDVKKKTNFSFLFLLLLLSFFPFFLSFASFFLSLLSFFFCTSQWWVFLILIPILILILF